MESVPVQGDMTHTRLSKLRLEVCTDAGFSSIPARYRILYIHPSSSRTYMWSISTRRFTSLVYMIHPPPIPVAVVIGHCSMQ